MFCHVVAVAVVYTILCVSFVLHSQALWHCQAGLKRHTRIVAVAGETTGEPHSSDDAAFQMLVEGGIARVVLRSATETHPHRQVRTMLSWVSLLP